MLKKNIIGIDKCKFEIKFQKEQTNIKKVIPLINPRNNFEFGEIAMERGKMMLTIWLPKFFDRHNAIPVRMEKVNYFDEIKDCVYKTIAKNFVGRFKTELVSIEVNITEVFTNCNYDKVCLLFSHSLLDKLKQNARYEIILDDIYFPLTSGIKTRIIKGRYLIKAYNKKKQLESQFGITIPYEPLRIEFVYTRLAIEKMFKTKSQLNYVLSEKGMEILVNTYVETMNELIHTYIYPYLNLLHKAMMIYMRKYRSVLDTYCEFKELIYDQEQLRLVLKEWDEERGMNDNSRITLAKLGKKHLLPKGTLKVISELSKLK